MPDRPASDCIFCRIAAGEIPSNQVHADDDCVAFHDLNPQAPVHVLVIPRRHLASVNDLTAADAELVGRLHVTARSVAEQLGIAASGYRLVLNCGDDGCQSVPHLHVHLLGGRQLGWPPG
jgi:histidine triad (HIT) family protein